MNQQPNQPQGVGVPMPDSHDSVNDAVSQALAYADAINSMNRRPGSGAFITELNHYQKLALKTESIADPLGARALSRVLHGAMGVATEAGELLDACKRSLFYGKKIDKVNIKEEIGDCLWYLAILADAIGCTLDDCATANIAKLAARYGEKFSSEAALVRNLAAERSVLEGQS